MENTNGMKREKVSRLIDDFFLGDNTGSTSFWVKRNYDIIESLLLPDYHKRLKRSFLETDL